MLGTLANHTCNEPYPTTYRAEVGQGPGERAPAFAGVHPRYDLSRWVGCSRNRLERGRWYRIADEALSAIHSGLAARAEKVEGGEDVEQYGGDRSTR
jgi:hypothetical protein